MEYLLLVLLLGLLATAAQRAFRSAFQRYSAVPALSGLSGAEAAATILRRNGVEGVRIEVAQGRLADHYDPRHRVLRLSAQVHQGRSVAALGVAAHEAGHALQHARRYAPLALRSVAVPTAGLGSQLGFPLLILGVVFHSLGLALAGLILFAAVVVFQLITLPVELDASRRAELALADCGIVRGPEEAAGVHRVLRAAAMTYVVAALTGVAMLIYWAAVVFGGQRR